MTLTEACAVGALAMTIILLLLQLGYRSAGWNRKNGGVQTARDIEAINKRLDQAGEKMSEWATFLQGVESRMRNEFVTTRFCDERHKALNREIVALRHDREAGG